MTVDEEIRRANDAERLMNEPLLKEAFDIVETTVIDAIKRSSIADAASHHEFALMLQVIGGVKRHFKEAMETGKLARIQKETMLERAKRKVRGAVGVY